MLHPSPAARSALLSVLTHDVGPAILELVPPLHNDLDREVFAADDAGEAQPAPDKAGRAHLQRDGPEYNLPSGVGRK